MLARPRLARIESTVLTCLALGAGLLAVSCAEPNVDVPASVRTAALTAAADASAGPGDLDVLFMVDNSSSMREMQQKLTDQIPLFVSALESLPTGLPNIHIAVISSDMGAPGDSTSAIGCTSAGDQGMFQAQPLGTCTDTTLPMGATFISNVGGVVNYTGNLSDVLSCIAPLGDKGCGFEHQLASISRALGADGAPAPASNVGFLRPDAQLAIVMLSNEDDCSAPANTDLYSLNTGGSDQQNLDNALGPVANYRCNAYGHLCVNAASSTSCLIEPPNHVPPSAQVTGTGVTLDLTDCESADGSGLLSSVQAFVSGIRALKADPDNQIVVGAIVAPATPYTVSWVPEQNGQNTQPGELWPQVEHSCGAAGGDDVNPLATQNPTDGSFGDPGVRLTQFVKGFGASGIVGSVCDSSYASTVTAIVGKIGEHLAGGATTSVAATGGTSGAALPVCTNGLNSGPGSIVTSGSGSGGSVGNGCGTGGAPVGSGLHGGGCAVGASAPGPWALAGLALLLALARRRRASAR
jgi:MYXO-CTERM domain-containing protein